MSAGVSQRSTRIRSAMSVNPAVLLSFSRMVLRYAGEKAIPVVMRAEVRRVDQHIEGLASRGRDARLGPCRGADVAGWIGSRLAPPVDGLELLLRVVGEDEVVVQQMVVAPVQPEVEHDAGTGRFVAAAALEARGRLASEQLAVSPHGIGVGDHRIERNAFARLRLDSPDAAIAR